MPDEGGALGIQPGRSEPYGDEGDTADEFARMFADASPDVTVEAAPEPQGPPVESDDEPPGVPGEAPPPDAEGPEEDEEPEADGGPPAPPSDEDALVSEETTEEELEAEVDEEARRFAGRYPSVEELERGYTNLQREFTRMAQDHRMNTEEREAVRSELEQTQAQLDSLVQMLLQREAENDPEFAERLRQQEQIQQAVDARVAPFEEAYDEDQEAYAEQMQVQAHRQQAAASIQQFYARHEGLAGSQEDQQMTRTLVELASYGVPVDVSRPDHLEAVYEATRDEGLKMELAFNPNAINVPGGISTLKARVGGTIAATQGAPPENGNGTSRRQQRNGPTRRRLEAHVEAPGGGAPVDTAPATGDEFDEAMGYWQGVRSKGPLFGSKR